MQKVFYFTVFAQYSIVICIVELADLLRVLFRIFKIRSRLNIGPVAAEHTLPMHHLHKLPAPNQTPIISRHHQQQQQPYKSRRHQRMPRQPGHRAKVVSPRPTRHAWPRVTSRNSSTASEMPSVRSWPSIQRTLRRSSAKNTNGRHETMATKSDLR